MHQNESVLIQSRDILSWIVDACIAIASDSVMLYSHSLEMLWLERLIIGRGFSSLKSNSS